MKTSASCWSQTWFPVVTASAPASMRSLHNRLGKAEAACRVLAVDDHEIQLEAFAEAGQFVADGVAAGAP